MNHKFNGKITKKAFEAAIIDEHGHDGLGASRYDEEGFDGAPAAKLTLYYKDGVHVGTWQKSGGWFAPAITNEDTLAKLNRFLKGEKTELPYLTLRAHGIFDSLQKADFRLFLLDNGITVAFNEKKEIVTIRQDALATV